MKKVYELVMKGTLVAGLMAMASCGSSNNSANNCNSGQVWSSQYNQCLSTCTPTSSNGYGYNGYSGYGYNGYNTTAGGTYGMYNGSCQLVSSAASGSCAGLVNSPYANYTSSTTVNGQAACCIPGVSPSATYSVCIPQVCSEIPRANGYGTYSGTFPSCY